MHCSQRRAVLGSASGDIRHTYVPQPSPYPSLRTHLSGLTTTNNSFNEDPAINDFLKARLAIGLMRVIVWYTCATNSLDSIVLF